MLMPIMKTRHKVSKIMSANGRNEIQLVNNKGLCASNGIV